MRKWKLSETNQPIQDHRSERKAGLDTQTQNKGGSGNADSKDRKASFRRSFLKGTKTSPFLCLSLLLKNLRREPDWLSLGHMLIPCLVE